MPILDRKPYGALAGGIYGDFPDPAEWQHQPGDHSDTGILPLLTPIGGTGGVSFGFSLSGTATQTFTASGGVVFGFSLSGEATYTAPEPTTFCDYDFADDTYDNADDTYDCSGEPTAEVVTGGHDGSKDDDWPDDAEAVAIILAALRAGLTI